MDARFIGAVVAVILTGASAMAEVSGYAHRIDFSVTGYKGTETLVNFPLIIKLSETIKGFKYSDFLSDGADLRFALKDGTVLQHELESWDTTGTSVAWVTPHRSRRCSRTPGSRWFITLRRRKAIMWMRREMVSPGLG